MRIIGTKLYVLNYEGLLVIGLVVGVLCGGAGYVVL